MTAPPEAACVVAVDPGTAKCGVAVVRCDGAVLHRAVVPTDTLEAELLRLCTQFQPVALLIGNGTMPRALRARLQHFASPTTPPTPLLWQDEAHTSEEARRRWVAANPPRGWQRLLPSCLRTPDCAYDDFVAVILAERYWQQRDESTGP